MDSDEAADRLAQAHRLNRLSAKRGAWITAIVTSIAVLAIATYIVVQFPLRSAEVTTPNTIGALAAGVVILVVCRAGLQRLASSTPSTGKAC